MKRKKQLLFLLVVLPLWLPVLGLVMEFYLRVRAAIPPSDHIQARITAYRAADDAAFQEVRAECPPPDTVLWRVPERDAFLHRDEAGRLSLAGKRQELILVCDEAGVASRVYPCVATPELARLSGRIAPGKSISTLLPPDEFNDALDAIQLARNNERPGRDYNVPLGDGAYHLVEINMLRLSMHHDSVVLFVGDSRFETFLYAYRPNIYRRNWYVRHFDNSEFWTNSRGFRDHEITVPKPPGMVRIVCVGGSTTVEGPHNNLTYPKLLEELLRDYFDTTAIEVINCGVDGMAFPGELQRMPDWLALEPDLIIHYNIINNAYLMIRLAMERARADREAPVMGTIERITMQSELLSALFADRFYPDIACYTRELRDAAIACLEEMERIARAAGVSMAAASFAVPDITGISTDERRYYEDTFHMPSIRNDLLELGRFIDEYNRLVREFCVEHGALYMPVAEELQGGLELFSDICHLRLPGIQQKARTMFTHLKSFVDERLKMSQVVSGRQATSPSH